ncbi:hypothetical protein C8J56DRAFT_730842, partial [Mycena floridula]
VDDHLFLNQDPEQYYPVAHSKLAAFQIFASQVPMESLDFVVGLSSISGYLGVVGQCNYASTNTSLEGAIRGYKNAFSLVIPALLDVGYINALSGPNANRDIFDNASEWGMTADELCVCLEDGLKKLKDGSETFNKYIPDLPWHAVDAHL